MNYQYDSRSEIVKKSVDHFEGANCHHDTDFDLENFRIVVGSVADDGLILSVTRLARPALTIYQNGQRQIDETRRTLEQEITNSDLALMVAEKEITDRDLQLMEVQSQ